MDVDELHCSNPECCEPLKKNKRNKYPKYCPECDSEVVIPTELSQSTDDLQQSTQGSTLGILSRHDSISLHLIDSGSSHKPAINDLETSHVEHAAEIVPAILADDHGHENAAADHPRALDSEPIAHETPSERPSHQHTTSMGGNLTEEEDDKYEKPRMLTASAGDTLVPASANLAPVSDTLDGKETDSNQLTISQTKSDIDSLNDATSPSQSVVQMCPVCGTSRKQSKKGTYPKYCRTCKHDFTVEVRDSYKDDGKSLDLHPISSLVVIPRPDADTNPEDPNVTRKNNGDEAKLDASDPRNTPQASQHSFAGEETMPIFSGKNNEADSMLASYVLIGSDGVLSSNDSLTSGNSIRQSVLAMSVESDVEDPLKDKEAYTLQKEMASLSLTSENSEVHILNRSTALDNKYTSDEDGFVTAESGDEEGSETEEEEGPSERGTDIYQTNNSAGCEEFNLSENIQSLDIAGVAVSESDDGTTLVIDHAVDLQGCFHTEQEQIDMEKEVVSMKARIDSPPSASTNPSGDPNVSERGFSDQQTENTQQPASLTMGIPPKPARRKLNSLPTGYIINQSTTEGPPPKPMPRPKPRQSNADASPTMTSTATTSTKEQQESPSQSENPINVTDMIPPVKRENTVKSINKTVEADAVSQDKSTNLDGGNPSQYRQSSSEGGSGGGQDHPTGQIVGQASDSQQFGPNAKAEGSVFSKPLFTSMQTNEGTADQVKSSDQQNTDGTSGDMGPKEQIHDQKEQTNADDDRQATEPKKEAVANCTRRRITAQATEITQQSQEGNSTEVISDEDIVKLLMSIRVRIDKAKGKQEYANENTLRSASAEANSRIKTFDGNKNQNKDNMEKWMQSQFYKDSVNGFRNFIRTYGKKLNKIFSNCNIEPIAGLEKILSSPDTKKQHQPESKWQRERTGRTFTFKAVLADVIVKHYRHQNVQPLVEIHSQVSSNGWGMLIKLERTENDTWTGEWKTARYDTNMEYKYVVYSGAQQDRAADLEYEWLGKDSRNGVIINRCINLSTYKADAVIYDGIIMIKNETPFWQKAVNLFTATFFEEGGDAKEHERCRGISKMLPDLVKEIKNGTRWSHLMETIKSIIHRQSDHLCGYSYKYTYNHSDAQNRVKVKEHVLGKVFDKFIGECIIGHNDLLQSSEDPEAMISSLLVIIWLACRIVNNVSYVSRYRDVIVMSLTETMVKAGALLQCERELQAIAPKDNPEHRKYANELITALTYAAQDLVDKYEEWVCIIPLVHMLANSDDLSSNNDWRNPVWWGLSQLKSMADSLRIHHYANHDCWRMMMERLGPFFPHSERLPYSLLALLNDIQLISLLQGIENADIFRLPLDGILAAVESCLRDSYQINTLVESLCQYMKLRAQTDQSGVGESCLKILSGEIQGAIVPITATFVDANILQLIQIHLLTLDAFLKSDNVLPITELGVPLVSMTEKMVKLYENRKYYIDDVLYIVETEVKQWVYLFNCEVNDPSLKQWWLDTASQALVSRLEKAADSGPEAVVDFYCNNDFENPVMEETIANAAFSRAVQLLAGRKSRMSEKMSVKLGKLVNHALTKVSQIEHTEDMGTVGNMLESENFVSVWQIYVSLNDEQKECISHRNATRLHKSTHSLETVYSKLLDGSINFADFQTLNNHKNKALALCAVSDKLQPKINAVVLAFNARQLELEAFMNFHNALTSLWNCCRASLSDDECVDIERWLKVSHAERSFRDTVNPKTQEVICEPVPSSVKDILERALMFQERVIFNDIFDRQIKKSSPGPLAAVVTLFNTALDKYLKIREGFSEGTLTVEYLHKLSRKYFKASEDVLLAELEQMLSCAEVFAERKGQIKMCANLEQYHTGARVLLDLKEQFNITGDFSDIEKITNLENNQLLLQDISPKLVESASSIIEITPKQIACLDAFRECSEMIDWIRLEVPKKDISNFVDLASSTLGEDDQAALKTRFLLNAITGYSPLIYGLETKEDEPIDYDTFIASCKEVWDAMKTNGELIMNLRESARELEWLRKVKTHFGNVEAKSIDQAIAINDFGYYHVGHIEDYSKDFKSADDVIQLRTKIPIKDRDREYETRNYSYSDLKELQSKLTLVAGEKQRQYTDDIRRFYAMKDAVENLAQAYIDIRREGCIQFDDMLVVVHCNRHHRTAIEVRLQSIGVVMLGQNTDTIDPIGHCQDLFRYMKDCITKWRSSMDEKRREYPELNYFSTEQLVVLRKQLGEFSEKQTSCSIPQALPLLAMIHPVDPGQLLQFITSYTPLVDQLEQTLSEGLETECTFVTYDEMTAEQQELVDDVLEEHEDFTEPLAVKAINELGNEADIETMLEWIENHKLERANDYEHVEKSKGNNESNLQNSTALMKTIMDEQPGNAPLLQKLGKLWENFIEHTNQSIKDFLGIPHLGHVLSKIQKLQTVPERTRQIPPWLKRGSPCLIARPQDEIYRTVLTVYAFDADYTYPTRNEVLISSTRTTVEEVRLFLARALNDPKSFYCMLNCHLLGYDVSRYIETRLSNTADDKVKTYGLAFIYAQEKKDARIRAYLDTHLAKNVELSGEAKLQQYVLEMLRLPEDVKLSACSVDYDRSGTRLLRSNRAGVGKSLEKLNLCKRVRQNRKLKGKDITIPVYKTVNTDNIIARLNDELGNGYTDSPHHTIHIDIAHEVEEGADDLLFNLIILRSIVNSEGVVWQAQKQQYYVIECMPQTKEDGENRRSIHEVIEYLPTTNCITPTEAVRVYASQNIPRHFNGFDEAVLSEPQWQIVIKYLECHRRNDRQYQKQEDDIVDPLQALLLLISNCGLQDPTWSELRHYVYFLSNQLNKVEQSPFCGLAFAEDLPGFRAFVVDFMFRMAKDFATRSLRIAEETPGLNLHEVEDEGDNILDQLAMKRTWESGNHPFLFFNEDGETFSPLGFFVDDQEDDNAMSLIDCQTGALLVPNCMPVALKRALDGYEVPMSEDFNALSRVEQLKKLRGVMVKTVIMSRPDEEQQRVDEPMFVDQDDPDPNYVLTMDNAKKILAIHQRLRVEIPVIIMGETGCGKTKLIDFMSKLQVPTALKDKINTMVIVKIHGGTTEDDIIRKVLKAQRLAQKNQEKCRAYAAEFESTQVPTVYTILFLDEANTTEAIGLVKEILCDGRIRGVPLETNTGLKIIAACNPYRRHSPQMIEKLKKAGLGYNVAEDETKDKFGKIPMRHLVYRVQALSQSLLPLVWDFGTLKSKTVDGVDLECAYIRQMIIKFNQKSGDDGLNFGLHTNLVAELLTMTQTFMREQKDECSFVSLRDVQRLLDVANWFYHQRRDLFLAIDQTDDDDVDNSEEEEAERPYDGQKDYATRSLILAIGICYMARLEDDTREIYAAHVGAKLEDLTGLEDIDGDEYLFQQIERCQDMFIREVIDEEQHLNIAMNKALKENVFMMIVCIENRIPLFVVGKPGSSKSLSKSMVIDSMKGTVSKKDLFKRMKRTYMVSFQCSRHAKPAGIVGVFNHCANFQKDVDLDKFVSVVVLDEVGLAEDSENMPLKTLHPLLEDGCEGNEKPEPWMKCAFVGISNWALDPAKMNRGIFVQRGTPNPEELTQIASEICQSAPKGYAKVGHFIGPLANGYLAICEAEKPDERKLTEFFGLRDFYSLMKMVVNFADQSRELNRNQLEHSIRRNFGGFDPASGFDPMAIFSEHCPTLDTLAPQTDGRPPIDPIGLIKSSLSGMDTAIKGMESRYLLILTENLSVLTVILNEFAEQKLQPEVVFGSKFREDVTYTQVCHNIHRIKNCMEMGRPVVLLNLDDLYESLYDALNQYFSTVGDRKFVDLGLGTHRTKTLVKDTFRLVVIADKNKVLSEFPIPLINRLEKHYVSATSLLTDSQKTINRRLEEWTRQFVRPQTASQQMCPAECDSCHKKLDKPYQLPCSRHYVGPCCQVRIQKAMDDDGDEGAKCCRCNTEIPLNFKWVVNIPALENRQYFENSTRETTFIGFSTETTALAVRQATEDIGIEGDFTDEDGSRYLDQVFARSQYYMLLCSTGEAVMRLDRTDLAHDARRLQDIYLHDQYHETMLQYLQNQLHQCGQNSLFMQVTSFAELMSPRDVHILSKDLNTQSPQNIDIFNIYLKDFAKEDQFTNSVRSFYTKEDTHAAKLLLVQCEAADENTELLDSVRFIVHRESESAEGITHTVLLLNLARGRVFTGYQGGKWKCVHIDDPRSPEIRLPSLSKCMELTPSEIIAKLLNHRDSRDEMREGTTTDCDTDIHTDTQVDAGVPRIMDHAITESDAAGSTADTRLMQMDEDDDMPPLEGDEEKITIPDNEYPDAELDLYSHQPNRGMEQPVPRPRARHIPPARIERREDDDEQMFANLMNFIVQCLPTALSVIITDSKYDRTTLLTSILERSQDFRQIFLRLVHGLLKKQEEYSTTHWVKADAAKASNMKQSETMRHALEHSLERAFVPALAAVIAFIDVRQNLALMERRDQTTTVWLQIFDSCDKLGLQVDPHTNKLPKSFKIHQAGEGSQCYRTQFPFSWLAHSTINKLLEAAHGPGIGTDELAEMVSRQFQSHSPIGKVIYDKQYSRLHGQLLENYINDFVYLTHPCASTHEHWIVGASIAKLLQQREIKANIVHVHLAYEQLKAVFCNLSVILSLAWNDRMESDRSLQVKEKIKDLTKSQPNIIMDCDLVALNSLLCDLSGTKPVELLTYPEMWVEKVEKSKYIVCKVLGRGKEDDDCEMRSECSQMWSKLILKKLYVEHVIIPTNPDPETKKRKTSKLAQFTRRVTVTSFQEFESFRIVYTRLRDIVMEGVQQLYRDCPGDCPSCKRPLHSPTKLPCQHFLCEKCAQELHLCHGCGMAVPDGYTYDPATDDIDEKKLEELKGLRKRLNKFFMAFVSEMVFGGDSDPDERIIEWLLDCITFKQGTREFSLYNTADVVDPTPVLRSFLLKLLLQCTQSDAVRQHLDRMLAGWSDETNKKVQTILLVMDCRKDFYHPQIMLRDVSFTDDDVDLISDRIEEPSVDILSSVAELQCLLTYGLSVMDLSVHQQATEQIRSVENSIRRFLLKSMQKDNPQPGYYMARQLLATQGESFIKDLINTPHNYLIPDEVKRDLESFTVPDVLSVYGGQQYRAAKAAIDEVIAQSTNADAFINAVNHLMQICISQWLLLEVVFTRITRTFVQRTPVPQNVTNELWAQLNSRLQGKQLDMLRMLLRDGSLPHEMDITSARGISLAMLVLSLLDCMCNNQPMSDLYPLSELINQPLQAADHYLPTMMDNQYELLAEDIRVALQRTGDNPVAYSCPNGHPYIIGDCGRPYTNAVCRECGAPIGGHNHQAIDGNRPINPIDGTQRTQRGHILGHAHQRPGPTPERDLKMLSCVVLRCLTHLCMYTGAIFNPQQVAGIIRSVQVPSNQIRAWLEAHIQKDIQQISHCCGVTPDDCILLLHDIINRMKGAARGGGLAVLTTIQQRKTWEAQFDNKYIKPTFNNNRDQKMRYIKQQLFTADSIDLKRILSTAGKPFNEENMLASPGLWEYKQNLTLPRVENILANNEQRQDYPTLRHMVKNCDSLVAVRLLPDVLELMKVFSDKFHSKFNRRMTSKEQIGQFCRKHEHEVPNIKHLVESFISAWNTMATHQRMSERQYEMLDITSPLSYFLLDQHSKRVDWDKYSLPFTLIIYLLDSHNQMVASEDDIPHISLSSVNSSNVITLESSDELLGVILSHSEYEMRETTTVTYNWRSVERELVMRYRNNKPILDFTVDQLQYYVFQEDFNLHNQLKSISESQEWLSPELQVSIVSRLPARVPTLTDHLKKLQVAINFLYGTRIDEDKPLAEYMAAFAPDLSYLPDTIKLKHVRDVWLLLKYAQTDLLMRQRQEPFDDIDTECRDTLSNTLRNSLDDCTVYNSPRTKLILQEMFKYIILKLNKAAASEGDLAEKPESSLSEALQLFIQYGANTDLDEERGYQIVADLPTIPPELLVKHTPSAWSYIWRRYNNRPD